MRSEETGALRQDWPRPVRSGETGLRAPAPGTSTMEPLGTAGHVISSGGGIRPAGRGQAGGRQGLAWMRRSRFQPLSPWRTRNKVPGRFMMAPDVAARPPHCPRSPL